MNEIRATVNALAGDKRPIGDKKYGEVLCYTRGLEGKKVAGWQGWVHGITEDGDNTYAVSIFMRDPYPTKGKLDADVILTHLEPRKIEALDAWRDPTSAYTSWQKVVFSGTIGLVTPSPGPGVFLLSDAVVESAK